MCLAIPGKREKIYETIPTLKMANVDFGGVKKDICIEWLDVDVGDFIIEHAGVAISKIEKVEAEEALRNLDSILDSFNL